MKIEKILSVFVGAFAFVFCISMYALLFQVISGDDDNKATIFGGVLGMIGGLSGALGAYYASVNQTRKEFERRDKETKIYSRPTINCTELHNVNEDLSNIKYSDSAILLSDTNFMKGSNQIKCPFYIIHFIGSFKIVLNVEINIIMAEGVEKSYPIGGIKQDNEILLSVPITKKVSPIKSEGSTDKIIISYITEKQEKIKYVYDNTNLKESYYLITENEELLLDEFDLQTGTWQIPGRFKNPSPPTKRIYFR